MASAIYGSSSTINTRTAAILRAGNVSSAYRNPDTGRQHAGVLIAGVIFGGCSETRRLEALWPPGPGLGGRPLPSGVLSPDRRVPGLLLLERGRYETIELDVVVPVLHGRLGEDGAMQGLLELSGIPYVGCDRPSSALCFDKSLTYAVAGRAGIATPRFWIVTTDEDTDVDRWAYPVFVKPVRSGSAFGVSKVLYHLATGELARMGDHDLMDPISLDTSVPSWRAAASRPMSRNGGATRSVTSRIPTPTSTSPSRRPDRAAWRRAPRG
jgi:D-ala D-ala ligase N-terminus